MSEEIRIYWNKRINEHMEDLAAERIKTEEESILDFKADEARMLELLERHDETCPGCQAESQAERTSISPSE